METGRGCVQFLYKSGLSLHYTGLFSPPLWLPACITILIWSSQVPKVLFSVPARFCPSGKTLVRACVDTITLILCPCRCQVSETTSLSVQSPEGCPSPLCIPPGAGKHRGIRKTPVTFVWICVSLLLQKHTPQLLCSGGQVMYLHLGLQKFGSRLGT